MIHGVGYIRIITDWVLEQDDITGFTIRCEPEKFGGPAIQVQLELPSSISKTCCISYVFSLNELRQMRSCDDTITKTLQDLAFEIREKARSGGNYKASPFL